MSKKILLLGVLPPPSGGVATWTRALLNGQFSRYKIAIVDMKILGGRKVFSKKYSFFLEAYRSISIIFKTFCKLIFYRPDVVHINCSTATVPGALRDFSCLLLCKLFSTPVVVQYLGMVDEKHNTLKKIIYITSLLAKKSIVLNIKSLNNLKAFFIQKNKPCDAMVLPLFISETTFSLPHKETTLEESKPFKFVFLGGITKQKGCAEILALAEYFPQVEFVMIGWVLQDMQALLLTKKSNVTLLGYLSEEEIPKQLINSDCFLFPSHTEGFPLSILEAMTLGLPVVATDVGAVAEMIDNGIGGFVVNCGNFNGLKSACEKMVLQTENLRSAMGQHNRNKVYESYTEKVVLSKLEALYDVATQLR